MGEPATSPDGATVAAYDIARLAGVGRAAVSNWRRRYPDFPKPVAGTTASPLYALAEVEAWLTRHGRAFRLSAGDRVWQRIRGTVEDLQLGDVIGHLGAFLVFCRRQPQRWQALARQPDGAVARTLGRAVAVAVPELPGNLAEPLDPGWVAIMRETAVAAAEHGNRELFELLCDRYLEIHSRRRLSATGPVAELMVDLADATRGRVLDPTCGLGTLLLAAEARGATELLGQEVDPSAARLSATRLLLREATARIHAGDSLRADAFDGELVDAVVCNPPFHDRSWGYDELSSDPRWEYGLPPRGEPELAWVQHCLSHVTAGRRVVIAVPAAVASRRAGRRIRSNLLRSGALRAAISLPEGSAGSAAPPDLWVLRRPADGDPAPSHMLVVDATSELAVAAKAWRAFLTGPDQAMPPTARAVRILDLLDEAVDLSPSRHLARPDADLSSRFAHTRTALHEAVAQLPAVPELAEQDTSPEPGQPSEVTIGELVRAGAVTVHQAPLRTTTDGGPVPALTTKDTRDRRVPSGRTTPAVGAVVLQPGDVVAPVASREPAALVVTDRIAAGGAVLGPQLYLLRPDPEHLDSHFLAGFLRVEASRVVHRAGSLGARSDIHRIAVPRLPLADQRRYGDAFRQLASFQDQAQRVASLADALVHQGLAGLAAGRLRPREEAG